MVISKKELPDFAAAAAKSLQSCPTLCDPIDGSPPGSPVPGILQARTLEWVAMAFSNAWKEKWKGSRLVVFDSSQPHGLQPTRLFRPGGFPGKSTGVGCHCFLHLSMLLSGISMCSPNWKLSINLPFGFLWRFHYRGKLIESLTIGSI